MLTANTKKMRFFILCRELSVIRFVLLPVHVEERAQTLGNRAPGLPAKCSNLDCIQVYPL